MSKHAKRSPSGAPGWLECAGWASDDKGSKYANEGTAAHELAAMCLADGTDTRDHLGIGIAAEGDVFTVTDEMALAVGDYVSYVRDVAKATGGELLVEQRLPIQGITGEVDAHGTSDAVILATNELIIADLKYGRGVPVAAEDNAQLQIYALAAMDEFSLAHDFAQVRMVIHQPRLGAVSEWAQTVEQLEEFRSHVKLRIKLHDDYPEARFPGTKQCQWCANKATCPAIRAEVMEMFVNVKPQAHSPDVDDAPLLAEAMSKADLIEGWVKAVRAETESKLLAGVGIPGWKLVQGKKGNRKWADESVAEELLKNTFRLKVEEAYDLKLISPTSAEKLHKAGVIGPRQWARVTPLMVQAEGSPSVAPESDKRPALVMAATVDEFDVVYEDLL